MAERHTAARMARLVAHWRRSSESGASFCAAAPDSTVDILVLVPKAVDRRGRDAAVRHRRDIRAVGITRDGSEAVIDIVLRGGDRLQVRAGASAELVRARFDLDPLSGAICFCSEIGGVIG